MDKGGECYRRFLAGDKAGLVDLVSLYYDGLVMFLMQIVGIPDVAEDLAEDTFLRLCVKQPNYKNEATFKTWLYTIARNLATDYLRKNKRFITLTDSVISERVEIKDSVSESFFKNEISVALRKAMCSIKPEYAQVLFLTYFENLSNKETAKILKKSVHAVENLNYRARIALKAELEKEGFTDEQI